MELVIEVLTRLVGAEAARGSDAFEVMCEVPLTLDLKQSEAVPRPSYRKQQAQIALGSTLNDQGLTRNAAKYVPSLRTNWT